MFSVDVNQFNIITKTNDVNSAAGFTTQIALTDSYYYARVYLKDSLGNWNEIKTTHTDQIYDVNVPTAVIRVLDGSVNVSIPVVYTSNGLIQGKLRMDIYQTRGDLKMLLSNYKFTDFSAEWKTIDENEATVYVAPVSNLKTVTIFSSSQTYGGRPALSLEDLRKRVINNSTGPQSLPITNVQLQSVLQDSGYEIVKNIDTITNRIFLATKSLPAPTDRSLITTAASTVASALFSFSEAATAHGVNVHANSITITPSAFYLNTAGVTKLVSAAEYTRLVGLNNALKCIEVNSKNYLYSPFHYVLDASNNTFSVRPYYLDNPQIISKSFIEENPPTALQVSVDSTYTIVRTPTGYRLTLSTKSNDAYKALDNANVFCQLSFQSKGQVVPAYMLGVQQTRALATDERVYVFDMNTNFDIDSNDMIDQQSFTFSPTTLTTRCSLLEVMNIYFATDAPLQGVIPLITTDSLLGRYQLPLKAIALTHEKIGIEFGKKLDTLWSQSRSITTSVPYQTYTSDVPSLYEKDVFNVDPVTNSAFTFDGSNNLVYSYLHRANDPVLDTNGQQVYLHRVGDPVLDIDGVPTPLTSYVSQMIRQVDIVAIEGAYQLATNSAAIDYRAQINAALVSWITEDLSLINSRLLDQTKIYFYPKATSGNIRIMTKDGVELSISAGQSFNVVLQVPPETFSNEVLKTALTKITITTIDNSIKNATIAISAIETALRSSYGGDVIDVNLSGLGGVSDFSALTVLDKSNRLSIRKKLVALPDDQLIVQEDVTVTFVQLGVSL
jgi:hypothetical protein